MFAVKSRQQEADPRVVQPLREMGINFVVGDDGDHSFGFNLGDGRSQVGFIRSSSYDFCAVNLLDVSSTGQHSMGRPSLASSKVSAKRPTKWRQDSWAGMTVDRQILGHGNIKWLALIETRLFLKRADWVRPSGTSAVASHRERRTANGD